MKSKMAVLDYNKVKEQIEKVINCKEKLCGTDHLIEMGLDSLQLMKLISIWRKNGYKVTFAELIEDPYLDSWWDILKKSHSLKSQYDITEKRDNTEVKSSHEGLETKEDGFYLTDVQYAYWLEGEKNKF